MARARLKVALVAYGVTEGGVKELIGYRLEPSESEAGWRRFLMGLYRRGLKGEKPAPGFWQAGHTTNHPTKSIGSETKTAWGLVLCANLNGSHN